jgi:hypothetical protein
VAVPDSVPDPAGNPQLKVLQQFRDAVYGCFTGWRDTLFEMIDAVLVSPQRLESLPWLSLEAPLRRGHGSIYRALRRGGCDSGKLADVLTGLVTGFTEPDLPLVFALDCSHWPRRDAATSPDRTFNYDATKDRYRDRGAPVTAGWYYQWIAATTWGHSSWALPVDLAWISPRDNHHAVAVKQVNTLLDRLSSIAPAPAPTQTPIVCLDGDYSTAWISRQLTGQPVQLLGRLRSDAALYTDPPARAPGTVGRQAIRGPKMKLSDPTTWPEPDEVRIIPARPDRGRTHELSIVAWHGLQPGHSRKLPETHPGRGRNRDVLRGNLIRIQSTKTGMKPIWLLWTGPPGSFDLDIAWRAYLHRFDIEHLFRFCKQHLGWTTPRIRTPDQATLWTWLTAAAYAHLIAARDLITDHRLPWEHPGTLSPLRVKRGFSVLHPDLGTPTRTPKKATPGPGRPPGRTSPPAPRHPVVRKRRRSTKPKTRNNKQATDTTTARSTARSG